MYVLLFHLSPISSNDRGGVLVHFWMIFVVPRLKTPTVCEECVSSILKDCVLTSLKNRSSVGFLLGLPVDIDSILINGRTNNIRQRLVLSPVLKICAILYYYVYCPMQKS